MKHHFLPSLFLSLFQIPTLHFLSFLQRQLPRSSLGFKVPKITKVKINFKKKKKKKVLLKDQVSAPLAPGLRASKGLQRTPHDVHGWASQCLWSCLHPPAVTGDFVAARMRLQVTGRGRGSCCFCHLRGQLEKEDWRRWLWWWAEQCG